MAVSSRDSTLCKQQRAPIPSTVNLMSLLLVAAYRGGCICNVSLLLLLALQVLRITIKWIIKSCVLCKTFYLSLIRDFGDLLTVYKTLKRAINSLLTLLTQSLTIISAHWWLIVNDKKPTNNMPGAQQSTSRPGDSDSGCQSSTRRGSASGDEMTTGFQTMKKKTIDVLLRKNCPGFL